MKLVLFKSDYADEFDVFGLELIPNEKLINLKEKLDNFFKNKKEISIYFGTNEHLTFTYSEKVMDSIKIVDVPQEVEDFLKKNVLSHNSFGFSFSNILDELNE